MYSRPTLCILIKQNGLVCCGFHICHMCSTTKVSTSHRRLTHRGAHSGAFVASCIYPTPTRTHTHTPTSTPTHTPTPTHNPKHTLLHPHRGPHHLRLLPLIPHRHCLLFACFIFIWNMLFPCLSYKSSLSAFQWRVSLYSWYFTNYDIQWIFPL